MKYTILALLLFFASCEKQQVTTIKGISINMPYRLLIGDTLSRSNRALVKSILDSAFADVNRISNHWNPKSELSFINRAKANKPIKISPHLSDLMRLATKIHNLSDGLYDPTLSPLIQIWKNSLNLQKIPSQKEIVAASQNIGWEHVVFENQTITKKRDALEIDLDSIAKGMAVDIVVQQLVDAGFENVYFEWAGEIRAHGHHPSGRPWNVSIYGPERPEDGAIPLENEAIATSGNYMQYWVIPNKKGGVTMYSHLLNKTTKSPIELQGKSILSVTVKAPSCALADGLATAAMLIDDPTELKNWTTKIKEEIPGVTFWIVRRQEF